MTTKAEQHRLDTAPCPGPSWNIEACDCAGPQEHAARKEIARLRHKLDVIKRVCDSEYVNVVEDQK